MRNFFDNPLLLLLLVLIIVLVFGANRLPGAARSLGRSMRIFKSEVREMKDEDGHRGDEASPSSAPLEGKVVDPSTRRTPETDARRAAGPDQQRDV